MIAEGRVSIAIQRQGRGRPTVTFSQPGDIGRLLDGLAATLALRGLRVLTHTQVPANDGGLSLGQAAIAALRS